MPVVVRRDNRIQHVGVSIGNRGLGRTETITDIGQLAVEQYQAVLPKIMARAIVRRVVKKSAIYATKEFANVEDPAASIALDLAGVLWEATESADTRCWGLLPDRIQVLRIELPAGSHDVELTPQDHRTAIGAGVIQNVQIEDGRTSYMLATFPDSRIVGDVLVSNGPGN